MNNTAITPVTGTIVPALAAVGLTIGYDLANRRYAVARDGEVLVFVYRATPSSRVHDIAYRVRDAAAVNSLGVLVDGDMLRTVDAILNVILVRDARVAAEARDRAEADAFLAAIGHRDGDDLLASLLRYASTAA